MNLAFNIFLMLHIIGGSVGLVSGLLNILRLKGDKVHKRIGRIFFVSMIVVGVSSLALSIFHPNYFLFMIGVFTLYMVGSGQRYLSHKKHDTIHSKKVDWALTIFMLIAGVLFVGIGILTILKSNLFGIVFTTFGCLGLLFVWQDIYNFNGKSAIKNYGLICHLQRMTGGFIAALTAFLVVNAKYFPQQIPGFVYWLLPTIILTPLIIKWSRTYEVKKNTNRSEQHV